ncbi:MAG: hypothetical protein LEGION0398_MBIBDBAK_00127 [Legionellaceae bacterium]
MTITKKKQGQFSEEKVEQKIIDTITLSYPSSKNENSSETSYSFIEKVNKVSEFANLIDFLQCDKFKLLDYECINTEAKLNDTQENQLLPIFFIKKRDKVNEFKLKNISGNEFFELYSLLQRKVSYAATIVNFLDYPGFPVENITLTHEEAKKIKKIVLDEINRSIDDTQSRVKRVSRGKKLFSKKETLNSFLARITKEICVVLGESADPEEIQSNIVHAERYHTAMLNQNRGISYESNINDNTLTYFEVPLKNRLTHKLKEEYLKIYHPIQPLWFIQLPNFVKSWLKSYIPTDINDDWSKFESLHFPSTIQNLPGIKNARKTYSFITTANNGKKKYELGYNGATLTPIEIKDNKTRKHITQLNVEQLYEHIDSTKEDFNDFWDGYLFKNICLRNNETYVIKPLIYLQSILSPIKGFGKLHIVDNHMITTQQKAANHFFNSPNSTLSNEFQLIQGNDPVNGLQGFFTTRSEYWKHTDELINSARYMLYSMMLKKGSKKNDFTNFDDLSVKEKNSYSVSKENLLEQEQYESWHASFLNDLDSLIASDLSDEALNDWVNKNLPFDEDSLQKARAILMIHAIKGLKTLENSKFFYNISARNYRMYKTLYQNLLAYAMHAITFTNCKSGKDRTGEVALYMQAGLFYYEQYGCLPCFNDTGIKRENFENIVQDLRIAKVFDISAGRNSPGADGIKDKQDNLNFLTVLSGLGIVTALMGILSIIGGLILTISFPPLLIIGISILIGGLGLTALSLKTFSSFKNQWLNIGFGYIFPALALSSAIIALSIGLSSLVAVSTVTPFLLPIAAAALSIFCVSLLCASAIFLYKKSIQFSRGVMDRDIAESCLEDINSSHNIAQMNKPKLKQIDTDFIDYQKPKKTFFSTTSCSLSQNYFNFENKLPAHLVSDKRIKTVLFKIKSIIVNKKTLTVEENNKVIQHLNEMKTKAKHEHYTIKKITLFENNLSNFVETDHVNDNHVCSKIMV